jgi:glycosyltransferase involved in cell wall biosynthesis
MKPMLSFILPAHNEAALLPATLTHLRRAAEALAQPYEIVVVADACTDATAQIAAANGARVHAVDLRQIGPVRNAGASVARGEFLVFLDADTLLPPETLAAAWRSLQAESIGGGCRIRFDASVPFGGWFGLMLWTGVARILRYAAGSFIFVRREDFFAVGGFDPRYFAAEEVFLSIALRRRGPWTILRQYVTTSARKMHSHRPADHFAVVFRMFFTLGKNLQRREDLDLWYKTDRGTEHRN